MTHGQMKASKFKAAAFPAPDSLQAPATNHQRGKPHEAQSPGLPHFLMPHGTQVHCHGKRCQILGSKRKSLRSLENCVN